MSTPDPLARALALLVVPVTAMVGLLLFEVIHVLGDEAHSLSDLPPSDMIIIFMGVSVLPIILLALGANIVFKWLSFVLAALLTLAHGAHVFEHFAGGDYYGAGYILGLMVLPSALAVINIWRT